MHIKGNVMKTIPHSYAVSALCKSCKSKPIFNFRPILKFIPSPSSPKKCGSALSKTYLDRIDFLTNFEIHAPPPPKEEVVKVANEFENNSENPEVILFFFNSDVA